MNLPLPATAASKQPISVAGLLERLPTESKLIVQDVLEYARIMSPKMRVDEKIGTHQQTKLFNALITLINKIEDSHRTAFAAVFLIIEENRHLAFHETNAFRFGEQARFLTKEKRKTFRALLHLFLTLGPRNTRAMLLRQINIDKVLGDPGISEAGRERLKSFLEQFRK